MKRAAVLAGWAAALCCSCDYGVDLFVNGSADHGRVFVCDDGCIQPSGDPGFEYCWNGTADELGELLGTHCRPISYDDRIWPWLVGCAHDCDGSLKPGPGPNAHCGTACP